ASSGSSLSTGDDAPLAAIDQGRRDAREMQAAHKQYEEFLHFTEQLFGNYLQSGVLPIQPIQTRIKDLIDKIREQKQYLLRIPELDPGSTNYLVDHAVKTALVGMATGNAMKMPPHRLIDIGTVALLHEVGMLRLPSQLYMTDQPLQEKEKKAISTAPVLGFKILRQMNYPMQICLGVLECRENIDGSGYPRSITGEKLSVYAKIINPASTFAAMASPRPYRPAIDGHTIMKTLLTGQNRKYEKDILQGMVAVFSLFPYGTFVQLASGHRAMVIDVIPGKARQPIVRVITDTKGSVVSEQAVMETETEQYAVTNVLTAEESKRLKNSL
ncbi:MAG TPA: HD domain-containing phosphohydrolase, partial [Alkalispirochaeta sp.]|nr:HD domain-containing phosphohydrolase [Alkalispirochaeta sp.]